MYFVFKENAYDAVDCLGEFRKDQLRALLTGGRDDNDIGYDKHDIKELIVIEGTELSPDMLLNIKNGL